MTFLSTCYGADIEALADEATIPAKLSANNWPGVAAVFDKIVVTLPTPGKVAIS